MANFIQEKYVPRDMCRRSTGMRLESILTNLFAYRENVPNFSAHGVKSHKIFSRERWSMQYKNSSTRKDVGQENLMP